MDCENCMMVFATAYEANACVDPEEREGTGSGGCILIFSYIRRIRSLFLGSKF